jgi:hypothetical protein
MPKRRHPEEMRSAWTTCAQYVHTRAAAGWQGTSRRTAMCSTVCADRRREHARMTLFGHRALPSILLILWQGEIALNQPRLRLPEDCIMNQCERSRPGKFLSYAC